MALVINFKPDSETFSESLCISDERKNELYLQWATIQDGEFEKLHSDDENETFSAARFTKNMLDVCVTAEECCLAFFFIGKTCQQVFNDPNVNITINQKQN